MRIRASSFSPQRVNVTVAVTGFSVSAGSGTMDVRVAKGLIVSSAVADDVARIAVGVRVMDIPQVGVTVTVNIGAASGVSVANLLCVNWEVKSGELDLSSSRPGATVAIFANWLSTRMLLLTLPFRIEPV